MIAVEAYDAAGNRSARASAPMRHERMPASHRPRPAGRHDPADHSDGRRRDRGDGVEHLAAVGCLVRRLRRRRLRLVQRRHHRQLSGVDQRDLLGPHVRSQLHTLCRRLRRERQPLQPQLCRLLDRALPRHDASLDADRTDADRVDRVDDRPRLGCVERQRRCRRIRRLPRHRPGRDHGLARLHVRFARLRDDLHRRRRRLRRCRWPVGACLPRRDDEKLCRRHRGAGSASEPDGDRRNAYLVHDVVERSHGQRRSDRLRRLPERNQGDDDHRDELHVRESHLRYDLHDRARGARRGRQHVERRLRERTRVDERMPGQRRQSGSDRACGHSRRGLTDVRGRCRGRGRPTTSASPATAITAAARGSGTAPDRAIRSPASPAARVTRLGSTPPTQPATAPRRRP